MNLSDIAGQEEACRLLKREYLRGRTSQAHLFLGPNQVGKTTAATVFARLLNCENVDENQVEPCGQCGTCQRIEGNRHPDFQVIRPRMYAERKSAGTSEDGRQLRELPPLAPEYMDDAIISIDVVRDFLEIASFKPVAGRRRVYIFCEAEKMNIQAQNCILKTLEEPIANVSIILITQHAGELLPTIVSRCQSVRFGLVAEEAIRLLLKERTDLDEESINSLASLSTGKPGWALRMAEHPEVLELRYQTLEIIERLAAGTSAEALGLAEKTIEFAEKLWRAENADPSGVALNDSGAQTRILRSSQATFLEILAGWFRDMLVAKYPQCQPAIIHLREMEWLQEAASGYSAEELLRSIEQIHQARRFILANANGHLVLEVLFLNLITRRKFR